MSSPSPTLKDLLTAAADGPVAGTPLAQLGRRAQLRERRRRLSVAAAVTAVVAGVAITGVVLVTTGSPPQKPAPATSKSHARHPGLVRETNVSSDPGRLSFEAPAGVVRWTFKTTRCQVSDTWLPAPGGADRHQPPPNSGFGVVVPSGGSTGGSAGFGARCLNPQLLVSASGSSGLNEKLFSYVGGRLGRQYAGMSMRVRVTLANGQSVTLQPQHGLWLAVAQRCGNYSATAFARVELINADGAVAKSTQLPAEPSLAVSNGGEVCAGKIANNKQ